MYCKKFFAGLTMVVSLLLVSNFCQASPMVNQEIHDTIEEMLSMTKNYDSAILEDDKSKGETLLENCNRTVKKAITLLNSIPKRNYTDYDCAAKATEIIQMRKMTLEEFVYTDSDNERQGMYDRWRRARMLRQDFFEKYGF